MVFESKPESQLLPNFMFQEFFRILLEAQSEGILDDTDMAEVERLILDPKMEKK